MEGLLPETHAGLLIRRASRADLPAIVHLMADDALGSKREQAVEPLPESYQQAFAYIDSDPSYELIVALQDGEIVGTLQSNYLQYLAYGGGRRCQVESVRVALPCRSQGIGRTMMQWVIARARRQGCHMVQLTSNKSRIDAHRFYQRLGFALSHEGMKLDLRL